MATTKKLSNLVSDRPSGRSDFLWQVGVYIRLSREDGHGESESVVNQKKILSEYLVNEFDGVYEIADYYMDDGLSGTDDNRENFMRLIQDIERGRVNCVICKTLSRAFRNYSDQGYYLEVYFPRKKVRFISISDPKVDTFRHPEAISGLEIPITGLMNDRYAAQTSHAIRRTFATKRRNGEFIGAFAPYGYLKDPENKNHLIIDPSIAPLKKDMLRWVIRDGMSLRGVAGRLNDRGIPNPTAYKRSLGWNYCNPKAGENDGLWTGTAVKRVLLDQANLGHMVQGKEKVVSYKVHDKVAVPREEWVVKENTHEPTFTNEEYDKLVNLLNRRMRTANGKGLLHLFSGYLRCGDCGKALQRRTAKGHVYYACRTYTDKSRDRCSKHAAAEVELEEVILAVLRIQIGLAELSECKGALSENEKASYHIGQLEARIAKQKKELNKTKALSDGLYIDWKLGVITIDDYRRMKIRFDEQILRIQTVITNLEEEKQQAAQTDSNEATALEEFLYHKNIIKLDRSILTELTEMIYVYEYRKIVIQFTYSFFRL
jgi:DNA invertase Pin-like site-specific DNA recombinase